MPGQNVLAIGSAAQSAAARTPARSPRTRVSANTDRIDVAASTQMPCEHRRRLARATGRTRRAPAPGPRERARPASRTGCRSAATVPADLVRVEEVLGPVVAGIGSPPITRCCKSAPSTSAAARPAAGARSARLGGRSSSGQGSRNPMTTSAASRKRIGTPWSATPALAAETSATEEAARPSTGPPRPSPPGCGGHGRAAAARAPARGRARGRPVTARVRGHRRRGGGVECDERRPAHGQWSLSGPVGDAGEYCQPARCDDSSARPPGGPRGRRGGGAAAPGAAAQHGNGPMNRFPRPPSRSGPSGS